MIYFTITRLESNMHPFDSIVGILILDGNVSVTFLSEDDSSFADPGIALNDDDVHSRSYNQGHASGMSLSSFQSCGNGLADAMYCVPTFGRVLIFKV